MRRVILLRHGRTEANEKWLYCGKTDIPLSPQGREALTAMRIGAEYPRIDGFSVFTSGLLRAEQTLELLFGSIPRKTAADLREMDFGIFEMRSYEDMKSEPDYIAWCSGNNEENRCPGGESGLDMTRRVLSAYSELLKTAGDLLIVCHGGPISAIMEQEFPDTGKSRYDWQPKGGCGYLLYYDENKVVNYVEIPRSKAIG